MTADDARRALLAHEAQRAEANKERAERHNAELRARLAAAKEEHGYLAVFLGTATVHAAVALTKGWGGYIHPRALCQKHTPRSYASAHETHHDVTCKRCLASLADLKHAVGAAGDTT